MKFVKNRVRFSYFESRTGYHFKAFFGWKQGHTFGVPVTQPHPKLGVYPPGLDFLKSPPPSQQFKGHYFFNLFVEKACLNAAYMRVIPHDITKWPRS